MARREINPEDGSLTGRVDLVHTWQAIEAGGERQVERPYDGHLYHPEREVQFSDGSGVRWQRTSSGSLRQMIRGDPEAIRVMMGSPLT